MDEEGSDEELEAIFASVEGVDFAGAVENAMMDFRERYLVGAVTDLDLRTVEAPAPGEGEAVLQGPDDEVASEEELAASVPKDKDGEEK